jgi:hypothetical protein
LRIKTLDVATFSPVADRAPKAALTFVGVYAP